MLGGTLDPDRGRACSLGPGSISTRRTTTCGGRWPNVPGTGAAALGLDVEPGEFRAGSTPCAMRSAPALTANRTMGSLGGLIASRIAREFRIGGPSFTVSCDETSGVQALAIAALWLERGELDAAVVGAVDFTGDIRALLARQTAADPRARGVRLVGSVSRTPGLNTASPAATAPSRWS